MCLICECSHLAMQHLLFPWWTCHECMQMGQLLTSFRQQHVNKQAFRHSCSLHWLWHPIFQRPCSPMQNWWPCGTSEQQSQQWTCQTVFWCFLASQVQNEHLVKLLPFLSNAVPAAATAATCGNATLVCASAHALSLVPVIVNTTLRLIELSLHHCHLSQLLIEEGRFPHPRPCWPTHACNNPEKSQFGAANEQKWQHP